MARFKHPTRTVSDSVVDPESGEMIVNTLRVRGLTRAEVAQVSTMGSRQAEVPLFVVRCAVVDGTTEADLDDIPPGLFAKAVDAVLELSGLSPADLKADPEKKAS